MNNPDFAAVYLSGQFNPCPCGYYFDSNDMEGLKKHHMNGHFNTEFVAQAEKDRLIKFQNRGPSCGL